MEHAEFKIYGYRWVVLAAFMMVVMVGQLLWITFAPITGNAAVYYGVSDLRIGLLSMSFLFVYIAISIPASWVINTYGIRVAVGIGAVFTGIFGLLRGVLAPNYTFVLIAQIGVAIGQPFIINAITTVAARWFPVQERAIAAGLGSLAMYSGIGAGLALTPYLTFHWQIGGMLLTYGIISMTAAIIFFALFRESPPTAPCPPDQEKRSLVFAGLKKSLCSKDFIYLLFIFFAGLGVFNAVTTWIEDIVRPRGFSIIQAGNAGGLMVVGGIIGAVLIPLISDHYGKRTPFLVSAMIGATLGLVGITFAASYWLVLSSAFVYGFFALSAGPIGFQYGAELTFPAPEGASIALLMITGQASGIVFIFGMDIFKSPEKGSMTLPLIVLIGLMVLGLFFSIRLRETDLFMRSRQS